jgi:lactoylglutathione lyase
VTPESPSSAALRCFPVVYASSPGTTARFYERLGFARRVQLPPEGEPGYIGLERDGAEVAVVDRAWPHDQFGEPAGTGMRFEIFLYVDDVDAVLSSLREAGVAVLRDPVDMPWGERVGYVADPDGNPVALAAPLG